MKDPTGRRDKSRSEAWAICDRTGTRYPMRDMVEEPGTKYLVYKWASDREWNAVEHPQANLGKYVRFGDPFSVEEARPNQVTATTAEYLNDFDDSVFTDNSGIQIELRNRE